MTTRARPVSRDDRSTPYPEPRLRSAFRRAAEDFYFNSWRFVPANLVWAASLAVVIVSTMLWAPAILLVVVAAVPVAGIHRMAALVVRGEATSFGDFVDGMRRAAVPAVAVGAAMTILLVVFTSNVLLGLQLDTPFGWFLTATAAYADVASLMVLVAFWPLLGDPQHEHLPRRRLLALAGIVCLARPGRIFVLTALVGAILIASTALVPAIALVGVAYASLLATRYVLPLADRLEARPPATQDS